MKVILQIVALFVIVVFGSCSSYDISAPDMPEVRFSQLKADNYTVYTNDTTNLHARVIKQCPLIAFQWSSTEGDLKGTENDVLFTAPSAACKVSVSCTVTHPGRIPVTKTVTITVKDKPKTNDPGNSVVPTPSF